MLKERMTPCYKKKQYNDSKTVNPNYQVKFIERGKIVETLFDQYVID